MRTLNSKDWTTLSPIFLSSDIENDTCWIFVVGGVVLSIRIFFSPLRPSTFDSTKLKDASSCEMAFVTSKDTSSCGMAFAVSNEFSPWKNKK